MSREILSPAPQSVWINHDQPRLQCRIYCVDPSILVVTKDDRYVGWQWSVALVGTEIFAVGFEDTESEAKSISLQVLGSARALAAEGLL